MSKRHKIWISVFAIVCSILASSIGVGFVGGSGLEFPQKVLCNALFMVQFPATVWCVTAIFRKTKER